MRGQSAARFKVDRSGSWRMGPSRPRRLRAIQSGAFKVRAISTEEARGAVLTATSLVLSEVIQERPVIIAGATDRIDCIDGAFIVTGRFFGSSKVLAKTESSDDLGFTLMLACPEAARKLKEPAASN